MINLNTLIWLAIAGFAGYYLIGAIRLKEAALRAVQQRCAEAGVQLLDSTVALRRVRLSRDGQGVLRLVREFQFEFTATGADRNYGVITLHGKRIIHIELAPHRF